MEHQVVSYPRLMSDQSCHPRLTTTTRCSNNDAHVSGVESMTVRRVHHTRTLVAQSMQRTHV